VASAEAAASDEAASAPTPSSAHGPLQPMAPLQPRTAAAAADSDGTAVSAAAPEGVDEEGGGASERCSSK
jgi:hypothetical protein